MEKALTVPILITDLTTPLKRREERATGHTVWLPACPCRGADPSSFNSLGKAAVYVKNALLIFASMAFGFAIAEGIVRYIDGYAMFDMPLSTPSALPPSTRKCLTSSRQSPASSGTGSSPIRRRSRTGVPCRQNGTTVSARSRPIRPQAASSCPRMPSRPGTLYSLRIHASTGCSNTAPPSCLSTIHPTGPPRRLIVFYPMSR